jgi:saccharopine dehydrogenase-like NADP-dependent oxidoreductase
MQKPQVTVLGAGLIGRAMVHDMCREAVVTVADHSQAALDGLGHLPAGKACVDLRATGALESVAARADLVLMAMPGLLGYEMLRRLIVMGKRVVDISFTEEDPQELDALAREHGAVVAPDAGVCPGLSNMAAGYAARHLFASLKKYVCYVGGLPVEPRGPWFYKNPFAAESVVDEYTRPCRFRVDGRDVVLEALSEPEELEFAGAGRLVAFATDGIRTLLGNLPEVPTLVEKTLRYREHYQFMRSLQAAGFLEPAHVGTFTEVARKGWKFDEGEEDITVMRLVFEGTLQGGEEARVTFDLFDRYDREARLLSMARTTGFTATAVGRLMLTGALATPGVHAPEKLGMEAGLYERVLGDLKARGIAFTESRG